MAAARRLSDYEQQLAEHRARLRRAREQERLTLAAAREQQRQNMRRAREDARTKLAEQRAAMKAQMDKHRAAQRDLLAAARQPLNRITRTPVNMARRAPAPPSPPSEEAQNPLEQWNVYLSALRGAGRDWRRGVVPGVAKRVAAHLAKILPDVGTPPLAAVVDSARLDVLAAGLAVAAPLSHTDSAFKTGSILHPLTHYELPLPAVGDTCELTHAPCLLHGAQEDMLVSSLSSLDVKKRAVEISSTLEKGKHYFLGAERGTGCAVFMDAETKVVFRVRGRVVEPLRVRADAPFVLQLLLREMEHLLDGLRGAPEARIDVFAQIFEKSWVSYLNVMRNCGVLDRATSDYVASVATFHERFDFRLRAGFKPTYQRGTVGSYWYAHPTHPKVRVTAVMRRNSPETVALFERIFEKIFHTKLEFIGVARLPHTQTVAPVFLCDGVQYQYVPATRELHEVYFYLHQPNETFINHDALSPTNRNAAFNTANGRGVPPASTRVTMEHDTGVDIVFDARNLEDRLAMVAYVNQENELNCITFLGELVYHGLSYLYFSDVMGAVVLERHGRLFTLRQGKLVYWEKADEEVAIPDTRYPPLSVQTPRLNLGYIPDFYFRHLNE